MTLFTRGAYFSFEGVLDRLVPSDSQFRPQNLEPRLFTIGLWQLNQDGTRKLDESGDPIPTYTNDHIMAFARVWTGFRQTSDVARGAISPAS